MHSSITNLPTQSLTYAINARRNKTNTVTNEVALAERRVVQYYTDKDLAAKVQKDRDQWKVQNSVLSTTQKTRSMTTWKGTCERLKYKENVVIVDMARNL